MYPRTQYNREGSVDDRNHWTISTGYVFIFMKYIMYIYILLYIIRIITKTMTITIIMQSVQRAYAPWKMGFFKTCPNKNLGELGTCDFIVYMMIYTYLYECYMQVAENLGDPQSIQIRPCQYWNTWWLGDPPFRKPLYIIIIVCIYIII